MFFQYLFYLGLIPIIMYEIIGFTAPTRLCRFMKKFESVKYPEERYAPEQMFFFVFGMFYWIYNIIGLMSSQWVEFLAILVLACITLLTRKLTKGKGFPILIWIDSFITLVILIFILVNKFSLHVNLIHYL